LYTPDIQIVQELVEDEAEFSNNMNGDEIDEDEIEEI